MKRMKLTEREMLRYVTAEALKYDKMESTSHVIDDFIIDCENLSYFINEDEAKKIVIAISGSGWAAGSGDHVMGQIVELELNDDMLKIIMIFKVEGSDKEYDVVEFKRI